MSLEAPNLDDRTFKDILAEAVKKIPRYCPEWTDFNPSDPGITLIELMAWMTETIIYRLNRVPDKNYIKFLELMGVDLKPPQPAEAWVVFNISNQAREEDLPLIPPGTRLSTGKGTGEPIVFETSQPLHLTAAKLVKVFSRYVDTFTDHTTALQSLGNGGGVRVFEGDEDVPHIFYLGGPVDLAAGQSTTLKLHLKQKEPVQGLSVQWESWDGQQWYPLVPSQDSTAGLCKSGEIIFEHLPYLHLKEIPPYGTFWLRACLVGLQDQTMPKIDELKRSFEIKEEYAVTPGKSFLSTEKVPYIPVDFSSVVYPFGKEPERDSVLYIGSPIFSKRGWHPQPIHGQPDAVLSETSSQKSAEITGIPGVLVKEDTEIFIEVKMSDSYSPPGIEDIKDLQLCWEYYSQAGTWKTIGVTAPTGVIRSEYGFSDETDAFTKSGTITCHCPGDTALTALPGGEDYWFRVRMIQGNWGKDTHAPLVKSLLMTYSEPPTPFDRYLAYNYFSYNDLTPLVMKQEPFRLFEIEPDQSPALYMGFDSPFSNKLHRIYFRLQPMNAASSTVFWEYYSEEGWKELKITADTTRNFSQSGAIEFIAPTDWEHTVIFKEEGFWLKARRETGDRTDSPILKGIHLNAVESKQAVTIRDELLGSGTGEPCQSFTFLQSPVLPGPRIIVKEKEEETLSGEEEWSQWQPVENFYYSNSESRHYILDLNKGTITFGDGTRGKTPPPGRDNIKCAEYYTGGGARGNVGSNTLTVLETSFSFVESVTNPEPAAGGADAETIQEAKLRGPWQLKHRYRAVTNEDFERLALEASKEAAKAACYTDKDGVITIILVPAGAQQKLLPKPMLVQKVKQYLDERRLLTTRIQVRGPVYVDISINAEVVPQTRSLHRTGELRNRIEQEIKQFFHPLNGGPNRTGWPMGRPVHISEIYYLLENIPGVDYVKEVILDNNPWTKRIEIGKMGFPYIKKMEVKLVGEVENG